MRCTKGDMAIVVRGLNVVNIGKVVTCLEYVGAVQGLQAKDYWLVDTNLYYTNGALSSHKPYASDATLKPIRDSDEPDEMLALAKAKELV